MADGLKLNLKEAILLKNAEGTWWEIKGKDNSGANFSWSSPIVLTADVSYDQTVTFFISGDCRIDWGDGSVETGVSGTVSHTYTASTGTYDIQVSSDGPKRVDRPDGSGNNAVVAVKGYYGGGNGSISRIGSNYLTSVPEVLPPDITSLEQAFFGSSVGDQGSQFLNDPNISGWDISRVTNMRSTFHGCNNFNQPLSSWDVSSVTTMRSMFNHAFDFNQDISGWDVSSVTDMRNMFEDARDFNQDISGWDVSNVTSASFMFLSAEVFNQDISGWDTSSFSGSLERMFQDADAFNQDISSWDVSGVTYMRGLFQATDSFNQDISSWDTSGVTDMASMFFAATAFNQDLGSLPINSVTNMGSMLKGDDVFYPSSMSTENYSRTLIGWANQHYAGNAQDNVPLGADTLTYNNTAYTTGNQFNDAVSARAYLVGTAGWTITDGGQV